MMQAQTLFNALLLETRNTMALYDHFSGITTPLDYSDLLRWQWIEAISAFDKLIHDIIRIGMVEIFCGRRMITAKYSSFVFPMSVVNDLRSNPGNEVQIFEQYVINKLGTMSFQAPDKVSDGLSHIWEEPHKWDRIASLMSVDANSLKVELSNIAIRRNQIAHESDYSSILMGRQAIAKPDVEDVIDFIRRTGNSICQLVI